MARDPRQDMLGLTASPEQRVAQRLQNLERAIADLRRDAGIVVAAAPPTHSAPDGALVVEPAKLWLRVGGTWKYAALT